MYFDHILSQVIIKIKSFMKYSKKGFRKFRKFLNVYTLKSLLKSELCHFEKVLFTVKPKLYKNIKLVIDCC